MIEMKDTSNYRDDAAMDESMAQKDRAGFTVEISNVTGGNSKAVGEGCCQEVGNPQPLDSGKPFPSGY